MTIRLRKFVKGIGKVKALAPKQTGLNYLKRFRAMRKARYPNPAKNFISREGKTFLRIDADRDWEQNSSRSWVRKEIPVCLCRQ